MGNTGGQGRRRPEARRVMRAGALAAALLLLALEALGILGAPTSRARGGEKECFIDPAYLSRAFAAIAHGYGGDYGICYSVMETGETAGWQEDKPFIGASTYKLFLVEYVYELAAAGGTSLDNTITYSPLDRSGGTGIIQFMPYGTTMTVRQVCRLTITHSDNCGANMLKRTYSYGAFRDFATSIGCPVSGTRDGRNMTTAREQCTILRRIMDFAASEPLGREVIQFLKDDIYRQRIPAGVPAGVEVGNKVGDYGGCANDSAVIFTEDSPYLLSVLSSGAGDSGCHVHASAYAYAYTASRICTGGHCVAAAAGTAPEWYFAEGYTGEGFQQWLCLQNPGEDASSVTIEYFSQELGTLPARALEVPAGSRLTVFVNADAGDGLQLAARVRVTGGPDITAERPMYFSFRDRCTGGHAAAGANAPATDWYFAEGYTGPGFEEWVTVYNPGDVQAALTFRFQTEERGELLADGLAVAARSRATFNVNQLAGPDLQLSLALHSTVPIVAERPMYFSYRGTGGWRWSGGHCGTGMTAMSDSYCFAEGTTRDGFEEWLTLQNPGTSAITVNAVYCFPGGSRAPLEKTYTVRAGGRLTVCVPEELGRGLDVSVALDSASPFAVERPIYFRYTGFGAWWSGGHCVSGIPALLDRACFAEGYTGPGFQQWLCLFNPGEATSKLNVTYQVQGEGPRTPLAVELAPRTRLTLRVNDHAGPGLQLSTLLEVVEGPPVAAERPMYFNYGGFAVP